MTDSKIESAKRLLAGGVPPKDVAKSLGVSIPTLYRWVPAAAHAKRAIFFPLVSRTPTRADVDISCPLRRTLYGLDLTDRSLAYDLSFRRLPPLATTPRTGRTGTATRLDGHRKIGERRPRAASIIELKDG